MGLITQPTIKGKGNDEEIMDKVSDYQLDTPGKVQRQTDVTRDMVQADNYVDNAWPEFNDSTLYDRGSSDQLMFNGNTPAGSGDPSEYWKANTVNPMVRNRCISIMAHLIQSYLYPTIVAQNEQSEIDKEVSVAFSDMVEWALEQADYSKKMMQMLYAFVSEPIVCVFVDYCDAKRKVKRQLDEEKDGKMWEWEEIDDEDFGGFQIDVVPYYEIFFGNPYEPDIQKQPFIIRRKEIAYTEAQIKYGHLDNWKYISPGTVSFLYPKDGTVYETEEGELNGQNVYEDTYYNKWADLELVYVNGVLIHDDIDRPMQRADKKYPFAETGYEMIHNKFIWKKSLVSKLASTQIDLNDLWNAVKDMARYQASPATFSYGFEEMDTSVNIPGMNTHVTNKEAGIVPINNGSDLGDAMSVIQMLQAEQNETSQSPRSGGSADKGQQTKYEIQTLEANQQTVLGLSGEMVSRIVEQIGELMLGLVLQHMPMTTIGEVVGDDTIINMAPIIIPNRDIDGKKMDRKVEFSTEMPVSEEDEMEKSFGILDEEGSKEMSIVRLNPDVMEIMKFFVKVEPNFVDRASKVSKSIALYDRMLANPMTQQNPQIMEAVTKDFLLAQLVPGEEYKYLPNGEEPIERVAKDMIEQKSEQKPKTSTPQTKVNINSPTDDNKI